MPAHEIAENPAVDARAMAAGQHIVETLIEERATKLRASPLWPLYRAVLYPLLRQPDAVRLADAVADMSGGDVLDHVNGILELDTVVTGIEHVPAAGRVIVAPTHPTGIADGLAMYDALKPVRSDLSIFANRDAIRAAPGLAEVLIPVEWVDARRTRERSRETLKGVVNALTSNRCVVLFPSGRLAYMDDNKTLTEQPWVTSVAIFARKYDCPIVPVHISARNSRLYYWFWKLNSELRDITLFNELLNKKGKRYEIIFGAPILPADLPADNQVAADALRAHAVAGLKAGGKWRNPDE